MDPCKNCDKVVIPNCTCAGKRMWQAEENGKKYLDSIKKPKDYFDRLRERQ